MTKRSPKVQVTVANFDSSLGRDIVRIVRNGIPLEKWAQTPLTSQDYNPNGGTPLLDATAQFIGHLKDQRGPGKVVVGLLCDESGSMGGNEKSIIDGVNEFVGSLTGVDAVDPESSGKVIAVILTDGYENMSQEVTRDQVQSLIAESEKDGFTFIYMGANQDAWGEATALGFSGTATASSVNYVSSPLGTSGALQGVANRTATYLSSNEAYAAATMDSAAFSNIAEDGTDSWAGGGASNAPGDGGPIKKPKTAKG